MKLKILSLKGTEFDGEAKGVNIKTTAGEITVLDNHLPLISVLEKGRAIIFLDQGRQELFINSGFLEVEPCNRAMLLIN